MEYGETPERCARRELFEETGVRARLTGLFGVYAGHDDPRVRSVLILYTDGITEVESPHDEEFGMDRVKEIVVGNRAGSAEEIQRSLMQAVSQHCEERFQDDATVVVIAVQ